VEASNSYVGTLIFGFSSFIAFLCYFLFYSLFLCFNFLLPFPSFLLFVFFLPFILSFFFDQSTTRETPVLELLLFVLYVGQLGRILCEYSTQPIGSLGGKVLFT
jgi:hypothetical protein